MVYYFFLWILKQPMCIFTQMTMRLPQPHNLSISLPASHLHSQDSNPYWFDYKRTTWEMSWQTDVEEYGSSKNWGYKAVCFPPPETWSFWKYRLTNSEGFDFGTYKCCGTLEKSYFKKKIYKSSLHKFENQITWLLCVAICHSHKHLQLQNWEHW